MVKPEDDFGGYMEDIQQKVQEEEAYQEQMRNHEVRQIVDKQTHTKYPREIDLMTLLQQIWRNTSWGGFFVRQIQKLGGHFAPFFEAVNDLVSTEDNSPEHLVFVAALRAATIAAYIIAAYAILKIFNSLLSREIVIEEEIIIDHDDDDADDTGDGDKKRRGARDKKTR